MIVVNILGVKGMIFITNQIVLKICSYPQISACLGIAVTCFAVSKLI